MSYVAVSAALPLRYHVLVRRWGRLEKQPLFFSMSDPLLNEFRQDDPEEEIRTIWKDGPFLSQIKLNL
ncbi:hypothetical protein AB6805_27300 [Chitinophaga sp. RCC_12]|uniref:hypothetical protein n=1 Tax=unclassified Chitinophaga TaxID=2619133 RepID=UPI0035255EEE